MPVITLMIPHYMCDRNLHNMTQNLEHDSALAIEWFNNNYMKLNEDKCHFFVSGHKSEYIWAKIGHTQLWEQNNVKLLGVNIDSKLSFNTHVSSLCVKTGRKLTALSRLAKFLTTQQRRVLIKAFIESQFNYCRLVWMFHSRTLNNKINKLQERSLRIIYCDDTSSFEELLRKDGSVTIHHRNIQALATEMYKVKNNLSPKIILDMFQLNIRQHSTRNANEFLLPRPKTENYGKQSLTYLQPLTKILRQIADLQEKLTFQAIWKVLNFSLEMTRLLKIEKWLEAWPLGCHPARNGHVTH